MSLKEAPEPAPILGKHHLEAALHSERQQISAGRLKEENPLDVSPEFSQFCEACRRGDLKACQEAISTGNVNINARDRYDYTPLILASLCGHYEVAVMLLEQGALCERDTFQGERCLYNALNDRIRNLLLSYDYSKSTDPLQPLAAHITGLLTRDTPQTGDITVYTGDAEFQLHKFVLAARSPYFAKKLEAAPETTSWRLAGAVPSESFEVCMRHLYLGDASVDTDDEGVIVGIEKLSRQLEIPQLMEHILASGDRRQARQRRTEELERGRDQLAQWFERSVLKRKIDVATDQAANVVWKRDNAIFADVLLQADEDEAMESNLPIGSFAQPQSTLFPAHKAFLLRSELFATMFASPFRESRASEHLQIIPVDCSPAVLEIVLSFLYTERADFPLSLALEVLHAADMLFIEKLKQRAALLISTLGATDSSNQDEQVDIYDIVRAGWDTRVQRLEEFGARFLAQRLERHIDSAEFKALVKESAARVTARQETDTVELVDDIRYYLSERFRLRFEDTGFDEMMAQEDEGVDVEDGNGSEEPDKRIKRQYDSDEGFVSQGPVVRTLDGEIAGDEFAQDAMNYQILLGKIDTLMEELGLDG